MNFYDCDDFEIFKTSELIKDPLLTSNALKKRHIEENYDNWVLCDKCKTWRKIDIIPKGKWFCSMNSNTNYNSCDKKQEDSIPYPKKGKRGCGQNFRNDLYKLINDKNNNDIISWTEDGNSFQIHDLIRFKDTYLCNSPWSHGKYTSFQRQLNLYSFTKDANENKYTNKYFKRDYPNLLEYIVRKG